MNVVVEGVQSITSQDMPLWHKEDFELGRNRHKKNSLGHLAGSAEGACLS